jgi:hypothetical protein
MYIEGMFNIIKVTFCQHFKILAKRRRKTYDFYRLCGKRTEEITQY